MPKTTEEMSASESALEHSREGRKGHLLQDAPLEDGPPKAPSPKSSPRRYMPFRESWSSAHVLPEDSPGHLRASNI